MKKFAVLILSLLILFTEGAHAQKYHSVKSKITFFSDAVVEDITATVSTSAGILDPATNHFAFSVPINDFQFDKSLMKEHFNEKYMESDRYPKATFTGTVSGLGKNSNPAEVIARGNLTIHGVTREVEIPATLKNENSGYVVNAKFLVKLEDHKIRIPQLLFQNIAEQVEVTVEFYLEPTK